MNPRPLHILQLKRLPVLSKQPKHGKLSLFVIFLNGVYALISCKDYDRGDSILLLFMIYGLYLGVM